MNQKPTVVVQECPAADRCRELGQDCSVCMDISEDDWRDHVRNVLSRGGGDESLSLEF
jgi:hypothetical protein